MQPTEEQKRRWALEAMEQHDQAQAEVKALKRRRPRRPKYTTCQGPGCDNPVKNRKYCDDYCRRAAHGIPSIRRSKDALALGRQGIKPGWSGFGGPSKDADDE